MANNIAPSGQLTTNTDAENLPGFPKGILGIDIVDKFHKQSERFGTEIFTERSRRSISPRGHSSSSPIRELCSPTHRCRHHLHRSCCETAELCRIWAYAVCDGATPIFTNKRGSGDSAMEEARYVQGVEDHAAEKGVLGGLKVKNVVTGDVSDLKVSGLFFAIGHEPAAKFLDGQLELDEDGYVVTKPSTTKTSVVGVFTAGDVQDKSYRQAITAAGTGLFSTSLFMFIEK
ncbi:unnamed protein product [Brassica rapa]|uniref:FAD/NAD(P)-binding domain-containing protein n=3 Tax=Brassica TaxID=3705 RepID=A0A8D9HZI3_BRACM|nr:unnamed protein product [Brassica napus]CAG7906469.1 unnamed protein product [Brassica rapa]